MKVIGQGSTYNIFDDSVQLIDNLPSQVYNIRFSQNTGFFLQRHADIEVNEEKVYGVHSEKVDKVVRTFSICDRNLGVIMSGDKGIGKSFFAKLLAKKMIECGIPVIIADTYIPGIANYIESIDQEVMILFDEYEKVFAERDGVDPQTEMLTLFDGLSTGSKLFVITCNDFRKLSDLLINRPGRFHYHFRFDYPSPNEVREYLADNVPEECKDEIEAAVMFSIKKPMNYDCLRAIAFELNMGYTFREAIRDLNIINTEKEKYTLIAEFKNGVRYSEVTRLDLFDLEERYNYLRKDIYDGAEIEVHYSMKDAVYDNIHEMYIIPGADVEANPFRDEDIERVKATIDSGLVCLKFKRENENARYHYVI